MAYFRVRLQQSLTDVRIAALKNYAMAKILQKGRKSCSDEADGLVDEEGAIMENLGRARVFIIHDE